MDILNGCMPHQNIIQLQIISKNSDYKIYKFKDILVDETRKVKKIKKADYLSKGKNPIVDQSKDFISGYTDCNDKIYKQYPYILFGDHTRVFKYINFESYLGADGAKIINVHEKYSEKIDIKYIYYFLKSVGIPDTGYNRHFKYVKSLLFPVPPMELQEKIVQVLDQTQALIDKRKEQIEALDQLIESIFYTMFGDPVRNEKGWEVKLLGEHIDVLGGYAFKSKEYTDIGIPIIKIGNINRGFFEEKNLCYYEEREDLNRYIIKPGDLLMSLTGTVGKNDYGNLCIIDDTFEKYYLNQRNAKLEILNSLNKLYLTYLLRTNRLKAELTKNNRGVRQANISNDDIKNLRIPIPHISLQNDFAQKVETIEKQKKLLEESLELLEENYKSIMARAFIGELFK